MKIIVAGATGYIGTLLLEHSLLYGATLGTASNSTQHVVLDLLHPRRFDYTKVETGDCILLLAAISSPDSCAREPDRAWAVNVTGTSEFIEQVMSKGGRVVFFSSDTVYGEKYDEFDEHAPCSPMGEYAEMKHEVENRFLGDPLFKTVRLSYVFSPEDKFTKYLAGCAERGEEAEIFHPFYRAVLYRADAVDGAIALARCWAEFPQSVINFGGPEILARNDFAKVLQDTIMPNLHFRVTEPGAGFFKNRPRVIRMASPILPDLLGRSTYSLGEAAKLEFNLKDTKHDG